MGFVTEVRTQDTRASSYKHATRCVLLHYPEEIPRTISVTVLSFKLEQRREQQLVQELK
jgi:hypothetical protein